METLIGVDWQRLFAFDTPLLEIVVRGTVMYLSLFILLRFILKREAGTVGLTDLLVIVLIADAAQNGMADDYSSILDGLALVTTIIVWSYALEWLSFHVPALRPYIRPPELQLVRNGRILRRNLQRELVTEEELMSLLRQQGVEDLSQVKLAYMEGDGHISVIQRGGHGHR